MAARGHVGKLGGKDARDGLLFGPPVWKTGLNCGKEYSRFHRVWVNGYGSN